LQYAFCLPWFSSCTPSYSACCAVKKRRNIGMAVNKQVNTGIRIVVMPIYLWKSRHYALSLYRPFELRPTLANTRIQFSARTPRAVH
jgi:hypothetical protein